MRRLLLVGIFICFASLAFAAELPTGASTPSESVITLTGTIVDNMCASAQKPEALSDFIKTHNKECALMPACAASGYAIFTDGKLYKFDKDSSAKIEEFLKKTDNKLEVVVTAKDINGELNLVTVENQK